LQRDEDLRIANLGPASSTEITIEGSRDFILAFDDDTNQAIEIEPALGGTGKRVRGESCTLPRERCVQGRLG